MEKSSFFDLKHGNGDIQEEEEKNIAWKDIKPNRTFHHVRRQYYYNKKRKMQQQFNNSKQ